MFIKLTWIGLKMIFLLSFYLHDIVISIAISQNNGQFGNKPIALQSEIILSFRYLDQTYTSLTGRANMIYFMDLGRLIEIRCRFLNIPNKPSE